MLQLIVILLICVWLWRKVNVTKKVDNLLYVLTDSIKVKIYGVGFLQPNIECCNRSNNIYRKKKNSVFYKLSLFILFVLRSLLTKVKEKGNGQRESRQTWESGWEEVMVEKKKKKKGCGKVKGVMGYEQRVKGRQIRGDKERRRRRHFEIHCGLRHAD